MCIRDRLRTNHPRWTSWRTASQKRQCVALTSIRTSCIFLRMCTTKNESTKTISSSRTTCGWIVCSVDGCQGIVHRACLIMRTLAVCQIVIFEQVQYMFLEQIRLINVYCYFKTNLWIFPSSCTVSYTHLDVYKRQLFERAWNLISLRATFYKIHTERWF